MAKPAKKSNIEECMEPIEGPKQMAAQIERLFSLIRTVTQKNYALTQKQAALFEDICQEMELQNSRGVRFDLGLREAVANMKTNRA